MQLQPVTDSLSFELLLLQLVDSVVLPSMNNSQLQLTLPPPLSFDMLSAGFQSLHTKQPSQLCAGEN